MNEMEMVHVWLMTITVFAGLLAAYATKRYWDFLKSVTDKGYSQKMIMGSGYPLWVAPDKKIEDTP